MSSPDFKIRYTSPPTRYDALPFNTVIKVLHDEPSDFSDMYIQITPDGEGPPVWLPMGDLLVGAFIHDMADAKERQVWIHRYCENLPHNPVNVHDNK
jgi:hypothetical protein